MTKGKTPKAILTRQKIIDTAFNITMNEGFDKATFVHIAKTAGISSSGINAHFDRKSDIAAVLAPMYAQIIKKPLRFGSPDEFFKSWVSAFDNNAEFKRAVLTAGPIIPKLDGVKGLFDAIDGNPEDVQKCVYMCMGYAVIHS
ncbi:TetR/AcrR family transcriptional regulator [Vibrio makurazakiensis]|uniref:TetR/AcrR family transcriptional regulator n=1 Tax=Vibrio makurazakiensis TaxID=2910250 RepID=UPI003D0C2E1C